MLNSKFEIKSYNPTKYSKNSKMPNAPSTNNKTCEPKNKLKKIGN